MAQLPKIEDLSLSDPFASFGPYVEGLQEEQLRAKVAESFDDATSRKIVQICKERGFTKLGKDVPNGSTGKLFVMEMGKQRVVAKLINGEKPERYKMSFYSFTPERLGGEAEAVLLHDVEGIVGTKWIIVRDAKSNIKSIDKNNLEKERAEGGMVIATFSEYVEGIDLVDLMMQKGPRPHSEIIQMGKDLLKQLQQIHKKGVIHRDLRADNVVIDPKGGAHLLDWGMSKNSQVNRTFTPCGNPNTIPPEFFKIEPYGPPSDMWNLGNLLFGARFNCNVFEGNNLPETTQEIRTYVNTGKPLIDFFYESALSPDCPALKRQDYAFFFKRYKDARQKMNIQELHLFDLAQKLLEIDPKRRLTAEQALAHPYFKEEEMKS